MSVAAAYCGGVVAGLERERALTVSAWADAHRMLSRISANEHGKWHTSRTPYLREIMDALSPLHPAQRVIFMKGSQVGGTECGNNWLGFMIHRDPAPILIVWPTIDAAKKNSKQRIAPLIAETPVLRRLVSDPRSRDSGNTLLTKEFEGGILMMTGANSATGLSSMPAKDLFLDEIDKYPGDVDGEGDPVALAEARTETFSYASKELLVSTPSIRGMSRIEAEYEASDRRRYFVPCPHCGYMDFVTWTGRDWLTAQEGSHHRIEWEEKRPETARMVCGNPGCSARVEEHHKTEMLAAGEWRATATGPPGTAGFHLSALYSPVGWKSWERCVRQFEKGKNDPPKMKTWVNSVLGETFEERGEAVSAEQLRDRTEVALKRRTVPHGVGILVAAVDVQGDRLEVAVKGYGAGEESWLVDYEALYGDPAQDGAWFLLDDFLKQGFEHEGGRTTYIERVVVDSGGLHTDEVYKYCSTRRFRRPARGWEMQTFPIKGGPHFGRPLVERPSLEKRYRVSLFFLCVDSGKSTVLSRLLVNTPGAGYIHLPAWVDDEYLEQLTSEKGVWAYAKGRGRVREWKKLRERNEAFDLEVYSLAALHIAGPTFVRELAARAGEFSKAPEGPKPAAVEPPPTLAAPGKMLGGRKPGREGWIDKWRR